jgi:hypothetical protein
MSDIVKWESSKYNAAPVPFTRWGEERALASIQRAGNLEAKKMIVQGQQDILRVDILAGVTDQGMQCAVDLDAERRALAGNDEGLNAQLTHLQMSFLSQVSSIIRHQGR